MRLLLIRHGDPDYEHDCLTEKGLRQAKQTAERLADEGITAIYSSPLGRARQTASFTAERLGLPVTVLPFFHEIIWGSPEGDAQVRSGHPWTLGDRMITEQADMSQWRTHPYFAHNTCTVCYDRIAPAFDAWLASLGWQREGTCYRCTAAQDLTAAVFAHGGSGACAISHLMSLPFPYVCSALPYDVCSVTGFWLPFEPGQRVFPRMELFNDIRHTREQDRAPLFFGN